MKKKKTDKNVSFRGLKTMSSTEKRLPLRTRVHLNNALVRGHLSC